MKKIMILFLVAITTLLANGQTKKIENKFVFKTAYPQAAENYSTNGELLQDNGNERTKIKNIFYYKTGATEKATAILLTFDWSTGEKASCRSCTAVVDVLNFVLKNNTWTCTKTTKKWSINLPTFGEEPKFEFKKYSNQNCIFNSFEVESRGGTFKVAQYYSCETHKLVKDLSKKVAE